MSSTNIMEDIAVEVQSDQPIKHEVEVVISPPLTSDKRSQSERTKAHVQLCLLAAMEGNWDKVKDLYDKYRDDISSVFSKQKNKALDFTAAADRTNFVKSLVDYLNVEDLLALKNAYGCTAFYWAAASGNLDLVDMMMNKKNGEHLINIPGFDNISLPLTSQSSPTEKEGKREGTSTLQIWPRHGILPLQAAAMSSHTKIVRRLYEKTRLDDVRDRIELLVTLIKIDSYDFALRLIGTYGRELATARDRNEETALHALSGKSMSSSNQLSPSTKSGSNKTRAQQEFEDLVDSIWSHVVRYDEEEISKLISYPFALIFHAACKENIEFLRILAHKRPDILWEVDHRKQTIFHVAAYNRQEKIVELLSEMRSLNDPRVFLTDENDNTILHLAAMAKENDVDGSNVMFGTAFELQQQWFKKVRLILPPVTVEARNKYAQTPRDLFEKAQGNLMKDCKKWMKETANSCIVVAALVATVAFAAAFTIPGGNKGDTGVPIFVKEDSFKVFAIFDAAALAFSIVSIITFLFMYGSSYSAEYFVCQLPSMLILGIGSLIVSIVSMMLVFCVAFFIVFHGQMKWVPILVTLISYMPVMVLGPVQRRLLGPVYSFFRVRLSV